MISERTFAERYTSFWNDCLPSAGDVTRAINDHLQREFSVPPTEPDREIRGEDLVGEISLRWLAARIGKKGTLTSRRPPRSTLDQLAAEAAEFIGRLKGAVAVPLPSPSETELSLAGEWADNLARFLAEHEAGQPIVARPRFEGCGLVSACRGDLLAGETLYEVKAVEKGFRREHLRQLMVYAALNAAAPRYQIRRVALVNPRRGTFFRSGLVWLVHNLAGRGTDELFGDIIDFISSDRISA